MTEYRLTSREGQFRIEQRNTSGEAWAPSYFYTDGTIESAVRRLRELRAVSGSLLESWEPVSEALVHAHQALAEL